MKRRDILFEQVLSVEKEIHGLGIVQTIKKCFDFIKNDDKKAASLSFLGLQYLQHSLHFHEPEFGTGEAIAYALYNIDNPRLSNLKEHYIATYGTATIKMIQRCVDASYKFFIEAINLEPEFGWAYYWRASVYRFKLEMEKGKSDLYKARELWWDDNNMEISEIDNYIDILTTEDQRLDEQFSNLAKNIDSTAAAFAFPLVQNKANNKLVPLIEHLNKNNY